MRERRIFWWARANGQRSSISTKKSLTNCTGGTQRLSEVFRAHAGDDSPALRDRRARALNVVERSATPYGRVEDVQWKRTYGGTLAFGADELDEALHGRPGTIRGPRPFPARSTGPRKVIK